MDLEKAGKEVEKVGCAVTQIVWGLLLLFIFGGCLWSMLTGG